MLHTQITDGSTDALIALMKAALVELTERHSADCSNALSESFTNAEAAIADLEAEIEIHLNDQRVNARLDRHTGMFARAA